MITVYGRNMFIVQGAGWKGLPGTKHCLAFAGKAGAYQNGAKNGTKL